MMIMGFYAVTILVAAATIFIVGIVAVAADAVLCATSKIHSI